MSKKVFVSHKDLDSAIARVVAERLESNNFKVYLDIIDEDAKDGPELADYIRQKLSECDKLIAVVSAETKYSWWVPWEIGVATDRDFLIATYAAGETDLPSYLKKWPYLKNLLDVDEYVKQVRNSELLIQKSYRAASVSQDFHINLKKALKQLN